MSNKVKIHTNLVGQMGLLFSIRELGGVTAKERRALQRALEGILPTLEEAKEEVDSFLRGEFGFTVLDEGE